MSDTVFCPACGKEMDITARACPACGAARNTARYKDKIAAAVLAFFLGGFGIHRFYLGQWWGLFYLLFCCTGIPAIVAFVECLVFLFCNREGWDAKYNGGSRTGSGSPFLWVAVALGIAALLTVPVIGILAAIAIPAYQDYTVKAKVTGAYGTAKVAADMVGTYYKQNQEIPETLQAAGFSIPLPAGVKSIEIDPQNAVLTVHFAGQAVEGKTLELTPSENANGDVEWSCSSADIPPRQLPVACR